MKSAIAIFLVLCCLMLCPISVFADDEDAETGTVIILGSEEAQSGTTGSSQTNTKSEEEIHNEQINSAIDDEFNNLFPDGYDPDSIQAWIDSQKDSVFTVDSIKVDKTFLEMYLNYLYALRGDPDWVNDALRNKTGAKYYMGDNETYSGNNRALVDGKGLVDDLGIPYDQAALDALIEWLQALYDGNLDSLMPGMDGYGSDLFELLGITAGNFQDLINAGLIRPDFGGGGIPLPDSIEDLKALLQAYLDRMNSGETDGLLLYKITEYNIQSYTHKHIVEKSPTGSYVWSVSPGDNISQTTDKNYIRIMFEGPGDYNVSVKAVCNVREGDLISGMQKEYWVLCNQDGSDAFIIRATSKSFTAAVRKGRVESKNLLLRNFLKNVTPNEAKSVVVMDTKGNTMAPADGFTTQRYQ